MQVYARPEAVEAGHAKYATEITPKILNFYENHFDLELRPKKLRKNLSEFIAKCQILKWKTVFNFVDVFFLIFSSVDLDKP